MLYALPTAQLAARVRSRHPTADVDTCAAAFWLWKERADEHLDALAQYGLVVADEVSQLDAGQFERILQMWEAADKIPALVFAGDFWQLPGVNDSQATDSPKWRSVFVVNLHEMWRCKDPALRKKLELLRTAGGHLPGTHSILPERLPALVRPAFDLVLRRIRSLKRCAQACGCKIMTPRHACNLAPGCISSEPTFAGLRKNKKKRRKGVPKKGVPKKKRKRVSFGKA